MERMPSTYRRRVVDGEIDELMAQLAAVNLDGLKGVGKTTTALQRAETVRRLDLPAERAVVEADPEVIAVDVAPVLVDEWQRVPDVWDAVRRVVDRDPRPGRFLLTGSAPTQGTHSGAGRIVDIRMRPMTLGERGVADPTVSLAALLSGDRAPVRGTSEVGLTDYVDEILASGLPGIRHLTGRVRTAQLESYLDRIATRELPEAGYNVRQPAMVRSWLAAYAAATATTASWEAIRRAASAGRDAKPAKSTTTAITEVLLELRILDPLDAWIPGTNHLKRLGRSPKHFLADPALAAQLLRRSRAHLLHGDEGWASHIQDGRLLGSLFASLAALSVRVLAQTAGAEVFHFRDHDGRHEVDFIVEHEDRILAMEVKLGSTVDDADGRHLRWLAEQLGDRVLDLVLITTGREAYRRRDGIAVVPLSLLGE